MRGRLLLLCLIFICGLSEAQVNLNSGLVAHYPFNGNANDVTGNNHHGQLINGLQLAADRFGTPNSAYQFDGVDDYIKVLDNGAFSSPTFSLVLWFQSQSNALQNLVGKRQFTTVGGTGGAQYQFFINYPPFPGIGSNLVGNNSSCSSISSSSYINTDSWICTNKWYCAVITFDGSRHKIYIDGVLKKDEPTAFNSFLACSSDLRFGNWWQGDLLPYKGLMDDIRWYNRSLSQAEVTALYGNFSTASGQCSATAGAGFLTPDTVCVNTPVTINNTSIGASSYYWNFCVANSNTNPVGTNLGAFGFTLPVFSDYAKDGNNYYSFVTNNFPGKLIRLDFGSSLLNTPVAYDFGDLGGAIPLQAEGIQIVRNEGRWYAIVVGGQPVGRIIKVDFGSTLSNNAPMATNWGNIGSLAYPTDLHVFQDGSNWYGLTINAQTNSITRFNFSNSFNNVPTGLNLGNIGGLNYPTGIYAVVRNNNWHAFISNAGAGLSNSTDASLSRLDFGTSLLNTPTGTNLGNPGNALSSPRDLTIYQSCNEVFGFVVNNASSKEIVRLNFNNLLTAVPTAAILGNTGNLSFPHSVSKLFRDGSDLYAFVTNVDNNSLTRLKLNGCNNANFANSTMQNPSPVTYNAAGTYSINLTVDDGLPTQSSYCKTVVVIANTHTPTQSKTICVGDSVLLSSSKPSGNLWNTGSVNTAIYASAAGTYWVQSSVAGCTNIDSFIVTVNPQPLVNLGVDTSLCSLDSMVLDAGNTGSLFVWQNGQTSQQFIVRQDGLYHVTVNKNGCIAKDSIQIAALLSPSISISNDTLICGNGNATLVAYGGDSYVWSPSTGLSSSISSIVLASPPTSTTYHLTATNTNGCKAKDSVTVSVIQTPVLNLGRDTSLCSLDSLILNAGSTNGVYTWQNGQNTQTFTVRQGGLYHVTINNSGCITKDSIQISHLLSPLITLSDDTTICKTGGAMLKASGGIQYSWSPTIGLSDTASAITFASPDATTKYLLTVKNADNCTAKDSVTVAVIPKPDFAAQSSRPILCIGDTVLLSASGGDTYAWFPAQSLSLPLSSTTNAFPAATTFYQVIITNNGCRLTDTLGINLPVADKPIATLTKSNDINCFQGQVTLSATGGGRYLWSPSGGLSDSTSKSPVGTLRQTTTYHVIITSVDGCQVDDSITVYVEKGDDGSGFPVPSAFTPNGDGKNDCFSVRHWGAVNDFSLNLYNRWGELVFHSDDPSKCWNGIYKGVLQPSDVYVYWIKSKTLCGEVFRKGTFALIK